jgi:hypothetical protein
MKLTRRTLLWMAAGGAGLLAAIPLLRSPTDPHGYFRSLVARTLGPIDLDEVGFKAFVADFLANEGDGHGLFATPASIVVARFSSQAPYSLLAPKRIRETARDLDLRFIEMFLLSTDMLIDGRSPDQPVRYVYYADPYLSGRANPFAKFDL